MAILSGSQRRSPQPIEASVVSLMQYFKVPPVSDFLCSGNIERIDVWTDSRERPRHLARDRRTRQKVVWRARRVVGGRRGRRNSLRSAQ